MAPHEHERRGDTKTNTDEESTAFRGEDDDYGGIIVDEDDGVLRGGPASASSRRRLVVVLTLARHADGVWITRLMSELRRRFSDHVGRDEDDGGCVHYEPVVVALETLLRPGCLGGFEVDGLPEEWACLVNRVSDAATPLEMKRCLAVLRAAEIWGIPVYNGPKAYSIGCHKLLHHQVFARAGLASPRSVPVRLGGGVGDGVSDAIEGTDTTSAEEELMRASKLLEEKGAKYPFLVKPNSAGFGAGIEIFHTPHDLADYGRRIDSARGENKVTAAAASASGPSNDGVVLLQEYLEPSGGFVYRVWFLDGRVRCATRREVVVVEEDDGSDAMTPKDRSFTGGCAGGVCALPPRTSRGANNRNRPSGEVPKEGRFRQQQQSGGKKTARVHAWTVPCVVEDEIGEILKVVGGDCHAGSVEFLVNPNTGDPQRVYFDLNMLSTLPIHDDGSVGGMDGVWQESFDPWRQLANSIAGMVLDGVEAR